VYEDGLWGYREWTREPQLFDARAPYLAALAVPTVLHQDSIYSRAPILGDTEIISDAEKPNDCRYRLNAAQAREFRKFMRTLGPHVKRARTAFEKERVALGLQEVEPPIMAQAIIVETLQFLSSGTLPNFPCFLAMWRAHQRAALELEAFVFWWARLNSEHPPDVGMQTWSRRGVILDQDELNEWWSWFGSKLALPVYGMVDVTKTYVEPFDVRRVSSSKCRYSLIPFSDWSK
jgi:hypothetical protein